MKTENGFTLVEVMIVVAVIGILAAIAYPSYSDYVTRGKLAEGTSALSDGRVKMEQFFQDNRTYVGGPAPAATTYFTYDRGTPTQTTYTLTATGTGSLALFVYTIDQNNTRRTIGVQPGWGTATPSTPANCWVARKGGAC